MFLDEYLFRTKQTQRAFAKKIGINSDYLSNLIRGHYRPSVDLAKKIQEASDGQVLWSELIEGCIKLQEERKKKKKETSSDNT